MFNSFRKELTDPQRQPTKRKKNAPFWHPRPLDIGPKTVTHETLSREQTDCASRFNQRLRIAAAERALFA